MDFGKLVRTLVAERGTGMVISSKVHHDNMQKDATDIENNGRFVVVIRSQKWHLKMFETTEFTYERLRAIELVEELGDSDACREIVRALVSYDPHTQILFLAVDESHTPSRYCFTPFRSTLQGDIKVPKVIEVVE